MSSEAISEVKQYTILNHHVDNFRCKEVYSEYVSLDENQHLCAGNMDGRGGTCVGDSGEIEILHKQFIMSSNR